MCTFVYLQFVFYLVMCILWLIVTIVQVVITLIAWLIWYIIRKVVESECEQIGDACVCHAEKSTPFTGKYNFITFLSNVVSKKINTVLSRVNAGSKLVKHLFEA